MFQKRWWYLLRIPQIRRGTKTFSRRCYSQRTQHHQINKLTTARGYRERAWHINRRLQKRLNRLNEIISFHSVKYPPNSMKTSPLPTYQIKRSSKSLVRLSDISKKTLNYQLLWIFMATNMNNSQINKMKYPNIKYRPWQA